MNKRIICTAIFCLAIVNGFYSCSKSGGNPGATKRNITYSIYANNIKVFSNITYTDTIGAPSFSSAADSTGQWSKTVVTSVSPFYAQLVAQGINAADSTLKFTMSIFLNGIEIASKNDSADKFASFNSQLAITIQ